MSSSATSILGKRRHDGTLDIGEPSTSCQRLFNYYYILEPEASSPSEEDTESVHSIQERTTDSAKDTPDTESSCSEEEITFCFAENARLQSTEDLEYEPRSLSDSDIRHPFTLNESFSTSSNDEDIIIRKGEMLIEAMTGTSSSTSSSSSETPDKIDPELSLTDYWFCIKCRNPNNNPLFRYCEKCFGDRKNFFPPRPKPKMRPKKQRTRRRTKKGKSSKVVSLSSAGANQATTSTSSSSSSSSSSSLPNSSQSTSTSQSTLKLSSSASTADSASFCSNYVSGSRTCTETQSNQTASVCENDSLVENKSPLDKVSSRSEVSCQTEASDRAASTSETCETCMNRPKDGVFIHTKIVHRYSCYRCSKRIWKEYGRCPLCNDKVCNVKKIAG